LSALTSSFPLHFFQQFALVVGVIFTQANTALYKTSFNIMS
jgi:hypothetical protein